MRGTNSLFGSKILHYKFIHPGYTSWFKVDESTSQRLQHHSLQSILGKLASGAGKTFTTFQVNTGDGVGERSKCKTSFIAIYISSSKPLVRLEVQLTRDALLIIRRRGKQGKREGAKPLPRNGDDASEPQPSKPIRLPLGTRHTTAATVSSTRHSGCTLIRQLRRDFGIHCRKEGLFVIR